MSVLRKTGGCAAGTGVEIVEVLRQEEVLHGEKYILPFPLLLSSLAAFSCCLKGSELDKDDLVHSHSGLTADKLQSSLLPVN